MTISPQDWMRLRADKLRAIARGKYKGIPSSRFEMNEAKEQLKFRGLRINNSKKENSNVLTLKQLMRM